MPKEPAGSDPEALASPRVPLARPGQAGGKDAAVEAALSALVPLRGPTAGPERETTPRVLFAPGSHLDAPDRIITAVRRLEALPAVYAPFPDGVDERLRAALAERGLTELYSHQAESIGHVLAGRNVVVTTPTASGKTVCYNVPVLNAILHDASTRAIYLFPTKALAQDQLAELDRLSDFISRTTGADLGAFTYDGDTPQDARRAIRTRAKIVLTNPDMLHSGILPHHPRWAKLFENLRYVVIDELHAYRGVFGSHLANVLRRLKRICRHYGSNPTFICSSATIANPRELAERLTEDEFVHVERSGAPRGEKVFVFVNPPVVNRQLGIRRSYITQSRMVAREFLRRNLQIIVFAQSRLTTEILTRYLKEDVGGPPGASDVIRGYRGGYLPKRRREIEKGLRDGAVRGVVATNALELGIDIGALDVAVLAGYPGTIAATWQRAGRAGRRTGRSAAVLVATSAPLDQYIVRNPSYFFGASPEHALINPDNLHILLDHVKCAAFELPFTTVETFGRHPVQEILAVLEEAGFVHLAESEIGGPDEARWHWTNESYPADAVSLRSVSSDNFVVVDQTDETRVIGETDFTSGPSTLHPKAIYIVEGTLYQVERLDFEGRKAYVREIDCDYYTDAITYSRVTILDCFASTGDQRAASSDQRSAESRAEFAGHESEKRPEAVQATGAAGRADGAHGEVHVVSRVVGFKKIKFNTNENVGSGELDLPEQQMHTTAFWLTIPQAVMGALQYGSDDRRDGVLGVSFAMKQVAQLLLMCDGHDIGISIGSSPLTGRSSATAGQDFGPAVGPSARQGSSVIPDSSAGQGSSSSVGRGFSLASTDFDEPRIFIYDNYPGGIGFSEPLFGMHRDLVARTREMIRDCPCESGCPSCVGPLGQVGPLAKIVALEILARIAPAGQPVA